MWGNLRSSIANAASAAAGAGDQHYRSDDEEDYDDDYDDDNMSNEDDNNEAPLRTTPGSLIAKLGHVVAPQQQQQEEVYYDDEHYGSEDSAIYEEEGEDYSEGEEEEEVDFEGRGGNQKGGLLSMGAGLIGRVGVGRALEKVAIAASSSPTKEPEIQEPEAYDYSTNESSNFDAIKPMAEDYNDDNEEFNDNEGDGSSNNEWNDSFDLDDDDENEIDLNDNGEAGHLQNDTKQEEEAKIPYDVTEESIQNIQPIISEPTPLEKVDDSGTNDDNYNGNVINIITEDIQSTTDGKKKLMETLRSSARTPTTPGYLLDASSDTSKKSSFGDSNVLEESNNIGDADEIVAAVTSPTIDPVCTDEVNKDEIEHSTDTSDEHEYFPQSKYTKEWGLESVQRLKEQDQEIHQINNTTIDNQMQSTTFEINDDVDDVENLNDEDVSTSKESLENDGNADDESVQTIDGSVTEQNIIEENVESVPLEENEQENQQEQEEENNQKKSTSTLVMNDSADDGEHLNDGNADDDSVETIDGSITEQHEIVEDVKLVPSEDKDLEQEQNPENHQMKSISTLDINDNVVDDENLNDEDLSIDKNSLGDDGFVDESIENTDGSITEQNETIEHIELAPSEEETSVCENQMDDEEIHLTQEEEENDDMVIAQTSQPSSAHSDAIESTSVVDDQDTEKEVSDEDECESEPVESDDENDTLVSDENENIETKDSTELADFSQASLDTEGNGTAPLEIEQVQENNGEDNIQQDEDFEVDESNSNEPNMDADDDLEEYNLVEEDLISNQSQDFDDQDSVQMMEKAESESVNSNVEENADAMGHTTSSLSFKGSSTSVSAPVPTPVAPFNFGAPTPAQAPSESTSSETVAVATAAPTPAAPFNFENSTSTTSAPTFSFAFTPAAPPVPIMNSGSPPQTQQHSSSGGNSGFSFGTAASASPVDPPLFGAAPAGTPERKAENEKGVIIQSIEEHEDFRKLMQEKDTIQSDLQAATELIEILQTQGLERENQQSERIEMLERKHQEEKEALVSEAKRVQALESQIDIEQIKESMKILEKQGLERENQHSEKIEMLEQKHLEEKNTLLSEVKRAQTIESQKATEEIKESMEKNVIALQQQMLEQQQEHEQQQKQFNQLINEVHSQMESLQVEKDKEIAKQKYKLSELQKRHSVALERVESKAAKTSLTLKEKDAEIRQLKTSIADMKKTIEQHEENVEAIEVEADELHDQNEDLKEQLEKVKNESEKLKNDLKKTNEEQESMLGIQMELQMLKEDNQREKDKLKNVLMSQNSAEANLTTERDAARAEALDSEQRLVALQADLDLVKSDYTRSITANSNLQRAMEAFQSEREAELALFEESKKSSEEAIIASHQLSLESMKKENELAMNEVQAATNKSVQNIMNELTSTEQKVEDSRKENVNLRRSLDEAIKRLQTNQEDVIDRSFMKNILLDWHSKGGKSKRDVMLVMASALHFTEKEKEACAIGEGSGTIGRVVGAVAPPLAPAAKTREELEGDTVREKWVNFLLAESGDNESVPTTSKRLKGATTI